MHPLALGFSKVEGRIALKETPPALCSVVSRSAPSTNGQALAIHRQPLRLRTKADNQIWKIPMPRQARSATSARSRAPRLQSSIDEFFETDCRIVFWPESIMLASQPAAAQKKNSPAIAIAARTRDGRVTCDIMWPNSPRRRAHHDRSTVKAIPVPTPSATIRV